MSNAIRITRKGGPEVLELFDYDPGLPSSGEILLRQATAGINLIDIYHRTSETGQCNARLPAIVGVEGAGIVEAVGEGVVGISPGDRVAYLMNLGAYAEHRLIAAKSVVKLPDEISFRDAAGAMVKGCTAQYPLHKIWCTRKGDTVLIHAAAGGVGSRLCNWASRLGARVIATVGNEEKTEIARRNGAIDVINYQTTDFSTAVQEMTNGQGVDVVFDSVGADTFGKSLTCLRPLGMLVS
ncbi:quinone oxidoreductase family protein [Paracoccus albus]|uniref:quinone oxidoreductase family protein n=1 Tax=Paracoccus albus TaxID=3017784 RepID=UPI0022F09E96|nr:quinone oxidoreductase [Paracoccus albus]WBU61853.1 quinone oxidoreductase [Paracoccus albus]